MPEKNIAGISIAYEEFGQSDDDVILLIPGLGSPYTVWRQTFIDRLVDANFRVIALDNRDSGQSQVLSPHLPKYFRWQILKYRLGFKIKAPYTLTQMSEDAAGLLRALFIPSAHIVGMSMGGMIAQNFALNHKRMTQSLTSIMSTTNNPRLPRGSSKITKHMLNAPRSEEREVNIAHMMQSWCFFEGIGFPVSEDDRRVFVEGLYDRGISRSGGARQLLAILAEPDRCPKLNHLQVPSLIIHGDDDQLLPLACGQDTAKAIVNARLEIVAGMGHDLAPTLVEPVSQLIIEHALAA